MPPPRSRVKGRILSGQSREIVANILQFLRRESELCHGYLRITSASGIESQEYIGDVMERCATATGVSERTISRIAQEQRRIETGEETSFSTPSKKKNMPRPKRDMDEFDKGVVRRTVYDFMVQEKCVPTLRGLCKKLKDDIEFTGGKNTLNRILHDLGFRWRRTEDNRRLLIEKHDIILKRIQYLIAMKSYREQFRPIVYTDESYILSSHSTPKTWRDDSTKGHKVPVSKGQRLIIIHAGGEAGFVPGAMLMWESQKKTGEYHEQMNRTNYEKWLREKLIPNLLPNTVVVVDNASYHNYQIDKAPTSNDNKQSIINWLKAHNIPHEAKMLKPQLYQLLLINKPQPKYAIDEIMRTHGHTVLRLPPYHPDLNPIEMIWGKVKNWVAQKNVSFKLKDVRELCERKFAAMSGSDWQPFCHRVTELEEDYRRKDHITDRVMEPIVIHVGESSGDSTDGDSDTDLESESDSCSGELPGVSPL